MYHVIIVIIIVRFVEYLVTSYMILSRCYYHLCVAMFVQISSAGCLSFI